MRRCVGDRGLEDASSFRRRPILVPAGVPSKGIRLRNRPSGARKRRNWRRNDLNVKIPGRAWRRGVPHPDQRSPETRGDHRRGQGDVALASADGATDVSMDKSLICTDDSSKKTDPYGELKVFAGSSSRELGAGDLQPPRHGAGAVGDDVSSARGTSSSASSRTSAAATSSSSRASTTRSTTTSSSCSSGSTPSSVPARCRSPR